MADQWSQVLLHRVLSCFIPFNKLKYFDAGRTTPGTDSFILLLPTGNVEHQQTQHFSAKDLWKLLAQMERDAKGNLASRSS